MLFSNHKVILFVWWIIFKRFGDVKCLMSSFVQTLPTNSDGRTALEAGKKKKKTRCRNVMIRNRPGKILYPRCPSLNNNNNNNRSRLFEEWITLFAFRTEQQTQITNSWERPMDCRAVNKHQGRRVGQKQARAVPGLTAGESEINTALKFLTN